MKKFIYLMLLLSMSIINAQHRCQATEKHNEKMASNATYRENYNRIEAILNNPRSGATYSTENTNVVVTIPVAVHILYKNSTQNISDAQINSQIAILNADYRKLNADFTAVVPEVWQPLGADLEINFVLAKRTPENQPTTGIERKSVPNSFNFDNQYYTTAGLEAWDTYSYLNIWVGRFTNTSLLGFAYKPGALGQPFDGLCIGDQFFGSTGTASPPYNLGRTATHEIGHYFNLDHPWGSGAGVTGANCGVGQNSDNVADTPSTSGFYEGCPSFPDNSKACTATANGSMFMNYMDYVNDACMALFTTGQRTRALAALNGPRSGLLTSLGGVSLGTDTFELNYTIQISPNPTSGNFSITSVNVLVDNIDIINSIGQLVSSKKIMQNNASVDVSDLTSGIYFVKLYNNGNVLKTERLIKN